MSDAEAIYLPPQLGKIVGESDEVYHLTEAVSKSKLDDFIHLPAYFHGRHVAKNIPREESTAFDVGKALHALVLEGPEAYSARFCGTPIGAPKRPTHAQLNAKKPSPETVAAIEYWAAFAAANAGKTILSGADVHSVYLMALSVFEHPTASVLLKGIEPEVGWRVDAGPFRLQCRTDAFGYASAELCALMAAQGVEMTVGEPYIADLKTTGDLGLADLRTWARSFVSFGYHRQGPFYQAVMKDVLGVFPARFFFIVVSKEAPHGCAVLLPDDAANERGWAEVKQALADLRGCYEAGVWPSLPTTVQKVSLPAWYGKEGL